MTHANYIKNQKSKWIGKTVRYKGTEYMVMDVDSNGMLMINKPFKYSESYTSPYTAIDELMLDKGKK